MVSTAAYWTVRKAFETGEVPCPPFLPECVLLCVPSRVKAVLDWANIWRRHIRDGEQQGEMPPADIQVTGNDGAVLPHDGVEVTAQRMEDRE